MSSFPRRNAFTDRRTLLAMGTALMTAVPMIGSASAKDRHSHAVSRRTPKSPVRTYKTSQTAAALRDLWVGHIFWVRAVVAGMIDKNDAATRAAEQQAVANAQSIAAAIEPFYGAAAKDGFFKLLAGHYGAVKRYLEGSIAGDARAEETATQLLTANAEEIADFLSKANPHLPRDAVLGLLLAHGGHHIQQIQQLKSRKYDAEARTWKEMTGHVYQIADATADALAKQFAKKFS